MPDWLRPHRTEAACDRILAAAGELFAERGVESVGMNEVARAAGCSRATLYRYFDNREALHAAYVHQQARALNLNLAELVSEISDPGDRLLAALTHALRLVRENPSLSAWFARTSLGAEAAEGSDVVQELTAGFLLSVHPDDVATARRRARWLVRVLTSFLAVPGRDADDERAMLKEFVIPVVLSASV
ncbi:MAG: TetR/AcrR family transcriptional regulator [Mycobacterium sp.]|nr:TetR/AcrR family transcriptional regulator [Mycobacterium sp.]